MTYTFTARPVTESRQFVLPNGQVWMVLTESTCNGAAVLVTAHDVAGVWLTSTVYLSKMEMEVAPGDTVDVLALFDRAGVAYAG